MARSGSPKFQCRQFVSPPRTWTPARRCALTFDARIDTGFREMNPLTQCVVVSFSGLDTFTCVAADRLLCQGLARFVASSCAWFSSELLVRLCSRRISRLVYISFAWRTHFGQPCARCAFVIWESWDDWDDWDSICHSGHAFHPFWTPFPLPAVAGDSLRAYCFSFPIRPILSSPAARPRTATDYTDSTDCFDRLPAFLAS